MWEVSEIQKSNELACMPEHVKFVPVWSGTLDVYDLAHAFVKAFADYMNPGDRVAHIMLHDLFDVECEEDFFVDKEEWEDRDAHVWREQYAERFLEDILDCLDMLCPEGWKFTKVGESTFGFARD